MEDLKNRIFRTIEKEIELQEFEQWLYKQSDLTERMDEDLILELFNFNYNQKGASHEFDRKFIGYFDKEEFTNWKILANLKTLVDGCNEPERILYDFKDLSEDGYPFLKHLGYAVYDLEECDYLGWDRQKLLEIDRIESEQLYAELTEWLQGSENNKLKDFKSNYQKSHIPRPVRTVTMPSDIRQSKKWWEFWK